MSSSSFSASSLLKMAAEQFGTKKGDEQKKITAKVGTSCEGDVIYDNVRIFLKSLNLLYSFVCFRLYPYQLMLT
jgi:hypothetical protein